MHATMHGYRAYDSHCTKMTSNYGMLWQSSADSICELNFGFVNSLLQSDVEKLRGKEWDERLLAGYQPAETNVNGEQKYTHRLAAVSIQGGAQQGECLGCRIAPLRRSDLCIQTQPHRMTFPVII